MRTQIAFLIAALLLAASMVGGCGLLSDIETVPNSLDSNDLTQPTAYSTSTETTSVPLPSEAIPTAWLASTQNTDYGWIALPMFSPPPEWQTYLDPTAGFQLSYPPGSTPVVDQGVLNLNLPFTPWTQMETKSLTIDARPMVEEICYGGIEWQGALPINGVDFKYNRGILWEHAAGGLTFYRSDFATYVNGMCYRVVMRMSVRDASGVTGNPPLPLPNRADLDIEVILDVLTTFKVSPQADGVMDTPAPCQTHSAELVISTAQQQASVGDAIEINVTFHNTGCALLGLPRYYLMVEQEPDLPALLPQEIAPVDHSLAVLPEGSDQVTFLLQAAAPGNATLSATVSFEAHLGYPGPAYWATASSEEATIRVSAR